MYQKNKKGTSCRETDDEQKMGDREAKERYVPTYTMYMYGNIIMKPTVYS